MAPIQPAYTINFSFLQSFERNYSLFYNRLKEIILFYRNFEQWRTQKFFKGWGGDYEHIKDVYTEKKFAYQILGFFPPEPHLLQKVSDFH